MLIVYENSLLMSDRKQIIIKDSCILFDLIDLGVLAQFYELNFIVFTTPQVIDEIKDEAQLKEVTIYIESGKLIIEKNGSYEDITVITDANPGLSFADGSVIECAIRIDALILSSDNSLRKRSLKMNLRVSGLLWIIDEMYKGNIIEKDRALELLEMYSSINDWAPKDEIRKMIERLTSK
jgi:predicted nucleic acid-binding protein